MNTLPAWTKMWTVASSAMLAMWPFLDCLRLPRQHAAYTAAPEVHHESHKAAAATGEQ